MCDKTYVGDIMLSQIFKMRQAISRVRAVKD